MIMTESKAMKELHETRLQNYEETKNMTNAEYVKNIKEQASKLKVKLPVVKKSTKV